jgi:hypothetical protein
MADSDIIITEILYDAVNTVNDNNHEWVEIFNSGPDPVALDGWTLDDSRTNNAAVGTFPNVTLQPGEIAIFYNDNITEAEFIALYNPEPGTVLIPVARWQPLNNSGGDTVNLTNDQGVVIQSVAYTDIAGPGQSINYTTDGVLEGAGIPDPGIVCFTSGSRVKCANGTRMIETLKPGDLIPTRDHGLQPILWIGRQSVAATGKFAPVRFCKGAIGNDQDLLVSPNHRMLISDWRAALFFAEDEVLVEAKHLVNGDTIHIHRQKTVEYFHLLFSRHEVITVGGVPSESYFPGHAVTRAEKDVRDEVLEIFPDIPNPALTEWALVRPVLKKHEARLLSC